MYLIEKTLPIFLTMNNRKYLSLFLLFIATVVATYTFLVKTHSVGKLYPWNQPAIAEEMSETAKTRLVSEAEKLNKLIDSVEKAEAELKGATSSEKTDNEEIIKNRQEISKIYTEMSHIINMELMNIVSTKNKANWSGSIKFMANSFEALATNSRQLNSPLTRVGG
jgi:hypothetical protein